MYAWDLETDFVSIGSGIGGLTAAIVAADLGLEALILEKSQFAGGVTAYSFGQVWVPNNHVARERGAGDSREQAQKYLDYLAAGFADPELADVFLRVSPTACEYLHQKAGVPFKVIENFSDYYYPEAPGGVREGRFLEIDPVDAKELGDWQHKVRVAPTVPYQLLHDEMFGWGGGAALANWDFGVMAARMEADERCLGPGLAAALVKAAVIDRGIELRLATPARRLLTDEAGAVVGVEAEHDGATIRIRARRGVLVATSGYDWDRGLLKAFEHRPVMHSMSPPGADGDNFALGSDVGAGVYSVPPQSGVPQLLGLRIPGETGDEGQEVWRETTFMLGYPHVVLVNAEGQRFGDESFYRSVMSATQDWDVEAQAFKNFPPYVIFDQNCNDRYPVMTYQPGQELPEEVFARADTLAELAEKLGIDPHGLESTVARWNGFCANAEDQDFARGSKPWSNLMSGDQTRDLPNPNMAPLDKAPFYGARLEALGAGIVSAGLTFDRFGRIVNARGNAVTGAYVAGNAAAYSELGAGYQSGFANCRGMMWAYIAAHHAAGVALDDDGVPLTANVGS